jgi:hypothetical protein
VDLASSRVKSPTTRWSKAENAVTDAPDDAVTKLVASGHHLDKIDASVTLLHA